MKILTAAAIRAWDEYTIKHEPVLSIDLMERAATTCTNWLQQHFPENSTYHIFCGKGNNGGDGLAIARMLATDSITSSVTVSILEFGHLGTDDFQANLARLHQFPQVTIRFIQSAAQFPVLTDKAIIVDALFGSGLNRPLEGVAAELVLFINQQATSIVSIDLPSGLLADTSSAGYVCVKADHTLSFQCMKLAFLVAENAFATGEIHLLDIGLHPDFLSSVHARYEQLDHSSICSLFRPRQRFAHKGNFGHALLLAGSEGKAGAALLSTKACLRTGAGLLTAHVPRCVGQVLQIAAPEAMVSVSAHDTIITGLPTELEKYTAIGAGPGLGTDRLTKDMLQILLTSYSRPLVLDADALNMIAAEPDLCKTLPQHSILTPHPKEFSRLFGNTRNDFQKIEMAIEQAAALQCIIILKGHYTLIASPEGQIYFNSTGNAGMATGGSGDVLTGILTSLLAQGYPPIDAARLGVYLHGKAGDFAAARHSQEAMVAGDIIENLGAAFFQLYK